MAATGQGLVVWDLTTGRKLRTMSNGAEASPSFAGIADRVAVSPDGSRVLSCERGGTTKLWSLSTGQPTLTIDEPAVCAAFSSDGKRIATADGNGNIKIWDASMTYEPSK